MDLLSFDIKRSRHLTDVPVNFSRNELSEMLGYRKVDAHLIGGLIHIFDEVSSRIIFENSGIGQWLDDGRKENRGVSKTCFRREGEEEISCGIPNMSGSSKEKSEEAVKNWTEQSPLMKSLVLSPMETVLLSVDWQILNVRQQENVLTHQEIWNKMKDYDNKSSHFGKYYSIYRYLKLNGWTVASGHTFGCDYLIYCLGAQFYHSSAGVLIADNIDPQRLLTLTRILAHNKKALIVATTEKDVLNFEDVISVEVKVVTMKTYFLERDVAQISNRQNEIYEVKLTD
ncbi:hypothetical protein CRE_00989 [Caenorhabditis remanei]|uniref:tRNA-intron lyase n=1 Tax=Caenorhabditis remanei TaxID=31234 RepID=E3MI43_CAERE|nr:hypothetical protein CRE_00989 [Caenorhabditis remanei]